MLKTNYGDKSWTFPGGAVDKLETIQECLERECREELSCDVTPSYLSGVYFSENHNSHVFMYRCSLNSEKIKLSDEHSEYKYLELNELGRSHLLRVEDCLNFKGLAFSKKL